MKKIFTIFSCIATSLAFAGTPTIDGTYSSTEGWGAVRGSGTQTGASNGWQGTEAKELYVTSDANYYYFGAKCNAASWMQFVFVLNTKAGGDSTDPWGRTIKYSQTNLPDYLFRGDIAGSNYAQYQVWDAGMNMWMGTSTNVNAGGTEVKGSFDAGNNGFIEIRVPLATISGNPMTGDVQFIITGNNGGAANGHGIFDAIPDESNVTGWSSPDNVTNATSYINMVPLPIKLSSFIGNFSQNKVVLNWKTSTENNAEGFDVEKQNGNIWNKIGNVKASNIATGSNYSFIDETLVNTNVYRLKYLNTNGTIVYSKALTVKATKSNTSEVYPTLVNGNLIHIKTNEIAQSQVTIKVMDMKGSVLQQNNINVNAGNSSQPFSLKNISRGMYFVEISTTSNTSISKIMVQ